MFECIYLYKHKLFGKYTKESFYNNKSFYRSSNCSVKTIGRRLLGYKMRTHCPANKVALTPYDAQGYLVFEQAHIHHPV